MNSVSYSKRIDAIQQAIHQALITYNREPDSVQLLAVSKGKMASDIRCAFEAGLQHFGESYFQEAREKISTLSDLPIQWHFIGPLQSNKAKGIACHFNWVHSISRLEIAEKLNEARKDESPPLNVCIQINFDDSNKSGIDPQQALELAHQISILPRLKLRGLMLIPKQLHDEELQYLSYLRLTQLFNRINQELNLSLDTLSMGMSEDFVAAIRAGSTMVRLGRSIFGV